MKQSVFINTQYSTVLLHCTQSSNSCTAGHTMRLPTIVTILTIHSVQNYRKPVSLSGPASTFIHVLISSQCLYDSSCHLKGALMHSRRT